MTHKPTMNDDNDSPPDLQKLVRQFGRYDLITPEAWAQWDRDNADWQARRRERYGGVTARPIDGRATR